MLRIQKTWLQNNSAQKFDVHKLGDHNWLTNAFAKLAELGTEVELCVASGTPWAKTAEELLLGASQLLL